MSDQRVKTNERAIYAHRMDPLELTGCIMCPIMTETAECTARMISSAEEVVDGMVRFAHEFTSISERGERDVDVLTDSDRLEA